MSSPSGRLRSVAGAFCVFVGLTAAPVDAGPIELSTVLNGVALTGTSTDSSLAFDCLPGAVCPSIVERNFILTIDSSTDDLELVLFPDLDPDLAALLKQIDADGTKTAAEKEQEGFALLKKAASTTPVDKAVEELVVKVPPNEKIDDFESSLLKKGAIGSEYFEYKNKAGFEAGYKPGGAAIIIYKPGTEEGRAVVKLTPVPEPSSLILLGGAVMGVLWRRRRKFRR